MSNRGATLLTFAVLLGAAPLAGAAILGGVGSSHSDCYLYFEGLTATGSKSNKVECTDNHDCDSDKASGKCKFTFQVCVNKTGDDVSGCTPGTVMKITPKKGQHTTFNYPALPASGTNLCGDPTSIVVDLGNKKKKGNKKTVMLNFKAVSTATPHADPDRLILTCIGSPSGAFVMDGVE